MRDPNLTIPEESTPALWLRYDRWRAMRHERFVDRHSGKLNRWRTSRGYRTLVALMGASALLLLVSAVVAFVSTVWFIIPFVIGLVGILIFLRMLRIVTGSIADAPVSALDEIQLAQRNSARSLGFVVLYSLMFVPYFVLVALSFRESVSSEMVYATAILLISLVLLAIIVPTALTAWWMTPPDEDDDLVPAHSPHPPAHSSGGHQ